jgi:glycerophosphoryl diester phosphodiesterase
MDRSSILAHRGLFHSLSDRNSISALKLALDQGFGLETDVRDLNGRVVISHDPPLEGEHPADLAWLLGRVVSSGSTGRIALNVKSDGLRSAISELVHLNQIKRDQLFVFDMSVPDLVSYLGSPISLYTRISEYEKDLPFVNKILGVWVDNFTGVFPQVQQAHQLMNRGLRATIVSPELHNRDHLPLWKEILSSGIHHNKLFELCTDLPKEAASYFCDRRDP